MEKHLSNIDTRILDLEKTNPVIYALLNKYRQGVYDYEECMVMMIISLANSNKTLNEMLLTLSEKSTTPLSLAIPKDQFDWYISQDVKGEK